MGVWLANMDAFVTEFGCGVVMSWLSFAESREMFRALTL